MEVTCYKCSGTGYIEKYAWFKGGVCFECEGTGKYVKRKKHGTTYHLSYNPISKFYFSDNSSNTRQQLGIGLYITTKGNVERWEQALKAGGREAKANLSELDTSDLTFVSFKDIPKDMATLSKDIISSFKGNSREASDFVRLNVPKGDTLGNDPYLLGLMNAWAKVNKFDGIYSWDYEEGEEIVVFDPTGIKIKRNIPFKEFIKED